MFATHQSRLHSSSASQGHARSRRISFAALAACAALILCRSTDLGADAPSPQSVLERFLAATAQRRPVSYRAVRRLEASSAKLKATGWVEALTEFDPSTGLRVRILAEEGSGRIRGALKGVLDAEREATLPGRTRNVALTAENYVFQPGAADADGLVAVRVTPRRRESWDPGARDLVAEPVPPTLSLPWFPPMRGADAPVTFCAFTRYHVTTSREDGSRLQHRGEDMAIQLQAQHRDFPTMERRGSAGEMVGTSIAWQSVMHRVDLVASTNATVLLLGETGTGKELLARSIHERSARRTRNMVVVDSGALPSSLIESELFGRERGAFTGAHTAQAGRFEMANGGTVFLDEIGELPLELQPKLLRVLQEGQVERLGCMRTTRVDIRIIAATNRNLPEEVRCGRFRADLFYRLNVFPITVPPLRDRRDDLPALVHHLADRLGHELGRPIERITPGSLEALARHQWPGNIRELENVLRRAIILSRDGLLDLSDFVGEPIDEVEAPASIAGRVRPLAEAERDHVNFVLEQAGWRVEGLAGAAALLGLKPSTLRSRMQKLGIERFPTARPTRGIGAVAHS